MRTRGGVYYPRAVVEDEKMKRVTKKRKVCLATGKAMVCRKRTKMIPVGPDLFDDLPDDLVLSILSKLGSTANCSSDFINVLITYVQDSLISFYFVLVCLVWRLLVRQTWFYGFGGVVFQI